MTKNKKMSNLALAVGSLFIILALVVRIFTHGLRSWYSAVFFILIGIVMIVNAVRWRQGAG